MLLTLLGTALERHRLCKRGVPWLRTLHRHDLLGCF